VSVAPAPAPSGAPPGPRSPARLARIGALLLLGGLAALGGGKAWRVARETWADLELPRERVPPARRAELPGAEDVVLTTADGLSLRGWYAPSRNGAAVAFLHGLGASRLQLLPVAAGLARRGYGVLLLDLRAHGESDGRRTTLGLAERLDAAAAVGFLAARPEVDPRRLAAVGFSLGGMALLPAAADDRRLAAVAVAGSFPSLAEMVRTDEPGLRGEVVLLALRAAGIEPGAIRPIDAVGRLAPRPLLLVYGSADPSAPLAEGLRARARGPARLVILPGVDHQGYAAAGLERFAAELEAFLDGALGARP
jgi:alpha-beta hydrolase superfamily lysophospholipase